MQSVSYRIDGKVAGTHLKKFICTHSHIYFNVLLVFLPFLFFVSCSLRAARFCRSMKIHFRCFFLRSHFSFFLRTLLSLWHDVCLFSFLSHHSSSLTFYFFMCICFIVVLAPLSLSLIIAYVEQKKVRRQEGTLKCVSTRHTHIPAHSILCRRKLFSQHHR